MKKFNEELERLCSGFCKELEQKHEYYAPTKAETRYEHALELVKNTGDVKAGKQLDYIYSSLT